MKLPKPHRARTSWAAPKAWRRPRCFPRWLRRKPTRGQNSSEAARRFSLWETGPTRVSVLATETTVWFQTPSHFRRTSFLAAVTTSSLPTSDIPRIRSLAANASGRRTVTCGTPRSSCAYSPANLDPDRCKRPSERCLGRLR
jgi:hypothetical protein